ncbi:MAG: Rne/Rng family ribonuclease [Ignavibacteriales bacterium]|nr:Rne/Rng family ribonuclease [Ignavibacteriales bacterium]
MKKEIVINSTANEHRIAILEDGKLAELFVETPGKERMVGDIYFGKIAKVMPGIRAAFIDVGLQQDAFLHFSDVGSSLSEYNALFDDEDDDEEESPAPASAPLSAEVDVASPPQAGTAPHPHESRRGGSHNGGSERFARSDRDINLQKGQDILVQITKEPVGKKGVRVTSEISLPGRFLVLLPFDGKVGVSKKLTDYKEKRRLRKVVRSILPQGFGAIIRTVAEGKEDSLIRQDLEELIRVWSNIQKAVKTENPPALVYKDMTTTSSVIRDLFGDRVERVAVDDKKLFKEIKAYVQWMSPDMLDRLEYYKGKEPIFDKYGVEKDIQTLMSKKVWLKSGGYIFLEKTEAMTVIDVNSGRYAAKKEQELNSLRTDLEASREITRQLRLRDIGGIIVIDFIDLEDEKNKKKVYDEVKKELKRDRAKTTVLPMTEFGLMQITRQRIRQNVQMSFSDACPTCGGTGMVQSKTTTLNQIERWIKRFKSESREFRLQLHVNPNTAMYLTQGTISRLTKIMFKFFVKVKVVPDQTMAMDEFRFTSVKQNKDITEQYRL